MPEAVVESRVSVSFDWGTVLMTLDEARELMEQLRDVLPKEDVEYNTRGSFGFRAPSEEENENE